MNCLRKLAKKLTRAKSKSKKYKQLTSSKNVIYPITNSPGEYIFYCPGCQSNHLIDITPNRPSFHRLTGTSEKPTIRASVLSRGDTKNGIPRCHSFVTNGEIKFLDDCTHDLAGKTVQLAPM
jgi:hypothetical protein